MVCEDDVTVKGGFSRMYPIGVANSEEYAGIVFSGENKEVAEAQNKGTRTFLLDKLVNFDMYSLILLHVF